MNRRSFLNLSSRPAAGTHREEMPKAVQCPTRRDVLLSAAGAALAAIPAFAKIRGVEFGVTGRPDDFLKCEQYGFDYFEPSGSGIAGMTDTVFAAFHDQVKASKIYCQSVITLISNPKLSSAPDSTP